MVLHGYVEYAPDQEHAMSVTIEQDGTESESSGSWTVNWNERSRKTTVAPFIVVHQTGERVRVVPGADARLEHDVIAKTERTSVNHRRRTAEIVEGADVWVTGILHKEISADAAGSYRGGRSWVMRASRGDPMVVSTLTPERRFVRDMKVARRLAVLFALTFIAAMAFELRYHALMFSGRAATARVTSISNISIDDGPDRCDLHVVVSDPKGTQTFTDDWDTECLSPPVAVGATFPCIASFGYGAALPYRAARASVAPMLVASFVWLVLAIASAITRNQKNWYDGKRVDESESGRLEAKS